MALALTPPHHKVLRRLNDVFRNKLSRNLRQTHFTEILFFLYKKIF